MQTIEKRHEIVVPARIRFCHCHFKDDAIGDPGILRALLCRFDGLVMVIESRELRFRIVLGHQNSRSAKSATNIRHSRACTQFCVDVLERWNPRANQIRSISGPEESFRAHKHVGMMLVPAHSFAGFEALFQLIFGLNRSQGHLEGSGQKCGTVIISQRESLLFTQIKFSAWRVVAHVPAGRLAAQPFPHVTFCSAGALRQLGRRLAPAGRQAFIQTQLVANRDQRRMKCCAKIDDTLTQ